MAHTLRSILAGLAGEPIEKVVVFLRNGARVVLPGHLLTAAVVSLPGEQQQPGLWLSPTETDIIRALEAGNWIPKDRLAERTGHALSSSFGSILTNLTERLILESGRNGYRLAIANGGH